MPESNEDAEKAIKRFRPYGRMIVKAVDKGAEFAKVKTLDNDEKSDGEIAFASLLYEEGAQLSARLLVLLWVITVLSSRLVEFFDNRKKANEARASLPGLPPQASYPEKT